MILELSNEELQLLGETLEEAIDDSKLVLDKLIKDEKMAETIDEFMEVTASQHERISGLQDLLKRVKEWQRT